MGSLTNDEQEDDFQNQIIILKIPINKKHNISRVYVHKENSLNKFFKATGAKLFLTNPKTHEIA